MGSSRYLAVLAAALVIAPVAARAQTPPPAAAPAAAPAPEPAKPAEAAPAGERAKVEGFRSARWGMTEAEVKAAIRKDFNIPPEKLGTEGNLSERTTGLTATVPDLLEGAGAAKVSYIFGYGSKKLIQVNVLWGTPIDPQVSPEKVVAGANQLRQLFLDSGYQPESIVTNAKMPDGSIVVFEGQDADKHATILRLASTVAMPPPVKGKEQKPVVSTVLSLSYVLDPHNPDIYRLKKGQF